MYLTRLELDEKKQKTRIGFATPSVFHGIVESAFQGKQHRNLWRIDHLRNKYYLIILSSEEPNLSEAVPQIGKDNIEWETKEYSMFLSKINDGSIWRFRLCANPTYTIKDGTRNRGRVRAHSTKQHQKEWLIDQGKKHGFKLTENSFDVMESKWLYFSKGIKNSKISMLLVSYEGILEVTDETLFKHVLTEGLGREKAYGVGLMTIAHMESRNG